MLTHGGHEKRRCNIKGPLGLFMRGDSVMTKKNNELGIIELLRLRSRINVTWKKASRCEDWEVYEICLTAWRALYDLSIQRGKSPFEEEEDIK